MTRNVYKRTTFVVPDAEVAAEYYKSVFGWSVWYDNTLEADRRFPPSGAPDKAKVRLIVLDCGDPNAGMLGLVSYIDPPFDIGVSSNRTKIKIGEPILVLSTDNIDQIHDRAVEAGATVVTTPVDWTVPTSDGEASISLRSISMFDPNGIYMEISQQ